MTAAASAVWLPVLSSIDQSLDEVRTVDDLSDKLRSVIRDVRGMWKLARALPSVGKLVAALARHWPLEFTSTDEVWMVAESIEPHVFEVFARLGTSGSVADVDANGVVAGLGADLSCRLAHVQTLARQLSEHHPRSSGPRSRSRSGSFFGDARARRAELHRTSDNGEVAPEIRLVLHQSRLLPVLIVLLNLIAAGETMHRVTKDTGLRTRRASHSPAMIQEALREGLNSMIGFLLAMLPAPPAPAPALIRDTLPEPMPLAELDERWRRVRETWTGTGKPA
jgi:hypothetical protein